MGSHTVCVFMTAAFLEFSRFCGDDLSTSVSEYGFPGLKLGDRWCLCAPRWREALELGQAPRLVLHFRSVQELGDIAKASDSTNHTTRGEKSPWAD
jgi:uncharacterized protein